VPYWGDARRSSDELVLDAADSLTREVVHFAESAAELQMLLERAAEEGAIAAGDPEKRRRLVRRHVHFSPATSCSDEVAEFVLRHIELARHAEKAAAERA
jgi:hypothetical protein